MTGRGEGYCVMRLPEPGQQADGYVGLQGTPMRLEMPPTGLGPGTRPALRFSPSARQGRAFRRGRGRGVRRGRAWQSAQW
jgi:hypothetical protein